MRTGLVSTCALFAAAVACVHKDVNECGGANPPDACGCDAIPPPEYCAGAGDAGGEGEGEGDGGGDGGGDAGDGGEGECEDTCLAPNVCDPAGECVTCYEDGDGAPHAGCREPLDVCADGQCVDCVDDGGAGPHPGCGAGAAWCVAGACEACRDDGGCEAGDAVFCDLEDHACRGCEADEECSAAGLGEGCLPDGACVACDEDADCGGVGCDPRANLCSGSAAGTVGQCQACLSDLDCDAGSGCVVVSFPVEGGAEVGTYCTLPCDPKAANDCLLNVGSRGYACLSVARRDGSLQNADFCVPATTTCEGYLAHDDAGCVGVQGVCSHDGDGGDADALCAGGRCTYPCSAPEDCPGGYGCGADVPGNCDVS
jgi:hypothetical protein